MGGDGSSLAERLPMFKTAWDQMRIPNGQKVKITAMEIDEVQKMAELGARELVRNDWVDVDSSRQKFAKSNAISPAMLLVNSESREVALKYYKLSFGDPILEPAYFDFDRDSLYFPSSSTDLGSFLIPD
ncbi:hypothetical protein ACEPPN_004838 [Leptodophora sp. 'Broadleaf-Isolate-01']